MFYDKQSSQEQLKYKQYLQLVGSLSNLFSDSSIPYLYLRSKYPNGIPPVRYAII